MTGAGRKRIKLTARSKQLVKETSKKKKRVKQEQLTQARQTAKRVQTEAEKCRDLLRPHLRTLLIGEGNFSFTRALVRMWEKEQKEDDEDSDDGIDNGRDVEDLVGFQVVATSYDGKEDLVEKYADVKDIVREIKASGVTVHTGIDATKLMESKRLVRSLADLCESEATTFTNGRAKKDEDADEDEDEDGEAEAETKRSKKKKHLAESVGFDRVVFNFPHLGCGETDTEKNNAMHREFLAKVFESVHTVLAEQGRMLLTIKSGEPYDSWRVAQVAVNTGLLKVHSQFSFDPSLYPGYEHRRTLGEHSGGDHEANSDITKAPARTYVFVKVDAASARAQRKAAMRAKQEQRRRDAIAAGNTQAMEMYEMNDKDDSDDEDEQQGNNDEAANDDDASDDEASDDAEVQSSKKRAKRAKSPAAQNSAKKRKQKK